LRVWEGWCFERILRTNEGGLLGKSVDWSSGGGELQGDFVKKAQRGKGGGRLLSLVRGRGQCKKKGTIKNLGDERATTNIRMEKLKRIPPEEYFRREGCQKEGGVWVRGEK